jgi:hypothetical protein
MCTLYSVDGCIEFAGFSVCNLHCHELLVPGVVAKLLQNCLGAFVMSFELLYRERERREGIILMFA